MISGFALFPGGATGAGLVLMRVSVAASLLMLSTLRFGGANVLQFLAVLAAISLCAGFQTRAVAAVSLAAPLISVAARADFAAIAALHAVNAIALVLTGPGAWSSDAASFGRRTVKLPDRDGSVE